MADTELTLEQRVLALEDLLETPQDLPISGLPAATTIAPTDLVPIVQSGTTKSATVSLINSIAESYADGKFFPKGTYTLGDIPVTGSDGQLHAIDGILQGTNISISTDATTGAKTISAPGVLTSVLESNIAFVDQNLGDDINGVVGDLTKPFVSYNGAANEIPDAALGNEYVVRFTAGTHGEVTDVILFEPFENIVGYGKYTTKLLGTYNADITFDYASSQLNIQGVQFTSFSFNLSTMINHSASTLILCQDCLFTSSFSLYGRWYGLTSSAPDIFNFDDCVFNVTGTVGTGTFNFSNGVGCPTSFSSVNGTTTVNFNNNPVDIVSFSSTIAARPMVARFIASPINDLTIDGLYTTIYADAVSILPAITSGITLTNGATLAQLIPLDKSGNILGAPLQLADLSALQNYAFIGQLKVGQWGYATDSGKIYVYKAIGNLSPTIHTLIPLEATVATPNIIWDASIYPNFSDFYAAYSLASITYNVVIELAGIGHAINARAYTNMQMISFNYGQPNNGFNQKNITVADGVTFDNAPNLLNNVVMTVNTTSAYLLTNPLNMSTAGMNIGDGSQLLAGSASTKIFDFSDNLSPITFNLNNGTIYGTTGAKIVNITAGGTNTIIINNSGTQAGVTPPSFYSSSAINLHITSEPDVEVTYQQTDFTNLTNITTFNLDYVANATKISYTVGHEVYLDCNRTDVYIEDGSEVKPFKTISAMATALAGATVGYAIHIAPGTYTEASALVMPNVPLTIYGNNSTVTLSGGVTFPNANYSRYDLNTTGNIVFSSTTTTGKILFQGGSLVGNLTLNGNLIDCKSISLLSGVITVNSPAQLLLIACTVTSTVTGGGIIFIEDINMNTNKTGYLITSTIGGTLAVSNSIITNLGTGGGISCDNGADGITRTNIVANNFIPTASGVSVATGTSKTIYSKNHIVIAPTGTGFIPVNSDITGAGNIMALGSDATYDMYYRNAAGVLSRIAPTVVGAAATLLSFTATSTPLWVIREQNLTTQTLSASDRWFLLGYINFEQATTNVDHSITITSVTNSFSSSNNSKISFTVKAYASVTPTVVRDYVYRILSGFNSAARMKWRAYIDETVTIYRGNIYIFGLFPSNCFSTVSFTPIGQIAVNSTYSSAATYAGTGADPTGITGLTLGYDSEVDDLGYSKYKSVSAVASFWTTSPSALLNYSLDGNMVTANFKTLQVIADVNTSSIIDFAAGTIPAAYAPPEDHYEDIYLFVNGAKARGTAVIKHTGEVQIYADISSLITVTDSSYVGYYNWSTSWVLNN